MKIMLSINFITGLFIFLVMQTQVSFAATSAADIFPQGSSLEFIYLNKIDVKQANRLIWDVKNQKYVNLNKCTNVIAESVSNDGSELKFTDTENPPNKDIPAHYVKLSLPRLDSLFNWKTTGIFGDYSCADENKVKNEAKAAQDALDKPMKSLATLSGAELAEAVKVNEVNKAKANKIEVVEGELYLINDNAIKQIPHSDVGASYGLMVVPFKKYTSAAGGALKDGGTIGAYAGYKNFFPEHGFAFTPVFAFGYSNQKYDALDQSSNVKEYSASVLSYAVGVIWGLSYDRFKVGLLYGKDRRVSADASAPSFNGAWWTVMFGIGLESSTTLSVPNLSGSKPAAP